MDDDKFYKVFDAYADVFEEAFPMMEYQEWSKDTMYDVMRECISKNKSVHLLYSKDMEVLY